VKATLAAVAAVRSLTNFTKQAQSSAAALEEGTSSLDAGPTQIADLKVGNAGHC